MLYEIHEAKIVAVNVEKLRDQFATLFVQFLMSTPAGERTFVGEYELRSPDEEAEERSRAALAELCRAAGISKLEDTDDLIGKKIDLGVNVFGSIHIRAFPSPEKAAHYMRPTAFSAKRSK